MTYTPGPWTVHRRPTYQGEEQDYPWGIDNDERGEAVAEVMEADDARLIAASPDLLEALRACWAFFTDGGVTSRDFDEVGDMVDAAIAKATGTEES